jgi:hypothetical protein
MEPANKFFNNLIFVWMGFAKVNNGLSKGIETPRRCLNVLSVQSYQSFPYAQGEDILSAECVDGKLKALPLGGGGANT